MRSIVACIVLGQGVTALHDRNHHTCLGFSSMHMGGGGFGKESKQRMPTAVAVPSSTPKQPVAGAGELPDDAFAQFPPLTAEQQSSLRKAKGGGQGLPQEVRQKDGT